MPKNKELSFYQTPEGKIVSYGVHETVNATCLIGSTIKIILNNPDKYTKEEILEYLKIIKERDIKRINDTIDYIHIEMKKLKGY